MPMSHQFSLVVFTKKLPESKGENVDNNSVQIDSESNGARNDTEETTTSADQVVAENRPENGEVISGKVVAGINYSVRVLSDRSYPNYSDLRESLLPACTIVDPRLRYGPPVAVDGRNDPIESEVTELPKT